MAVTIPCTKCGVGISVDDETVMAALNARSTLAPMHEVCPVDVVAEKPLRFFGIKIMITEYPNGEFKDDEGASSATMGARLEGDSFADLVPNFIKELNKQWEKIVRLAPIVDGDPPFKDEFAELRKET